MIGLIVLAQPLLRDVEIFCRNPTKRPRYLVVKDEKGKTYKRCLIDAQHSRNKNILQQMQQNIPYGRLWQ